MSGVPTRLMVSAAHGDGGQGAAFSARSGSAAAYSPAATIRQTTGHRQRTRARAATGSARRSR